MTRGAVPPSRTGRGGGDPPADLTIIQSTHASMRGLEVCGLLERHARLLREYSRVFRVVVHSSDTVDYSARLGVTHRPVRWLPRWPGLRHAAYFLALAWRARRMTGIIKVFGSNIPTLGLVRAISRRPLIVTFQFDYAGLAERTWGRVHVRARLARFLERSAVKPADLVFVTTAVLERKVREIYRRPTVLLPNWFDDGAIPDATARRDAGLVVYAGRLHPVKGVDVLVRAFAGVKAERPAARLVILGAGEERARLGILAASLGVEPGVFKDSVPNAEILSWLARAEVFVLPTVSMEGHPKALVEAMACGAACVATDIPGNGDLVDDGESGLLVPPQDDRAMACAILRLLGDDDLRQRLGHAARERVAGLRFHVIVSRELDILQQVQRAMPSPGISASGAETIPPAVSRDG